MIENDHDQKTEILKVDPTVTREIQNPISEGGRHEGFIPPEQDADPCVDSSLRRAMQATEALPDNADRSRAILEQTKHSDHENNLFPQDGYAEKNVKDFPPLPEDGSKVQFHEDGFAWLSKEGTVTVETKLGEPTDRRNFEDYLPTSTELGLKCAYERAHSQGAGTGVESPYGLALATREVNQELQNHGVEAFIRELQAHKRDDVDLYLRTEVNTDGLYLQSINYVLEAANKSDGFIENRQERATLLTANIDVSSSRDDPRATFDADDCSCYHDRISAILESASDIKEQPRNRR